MKWYACAQGHRYLIPESVGAPFCGACHARWAALAFPIAPVRGPAPVPIPPPPVPVPPGPIPPLPPPPTAAEVAAVLDGFGRYRSAPPPSGPPPAQGGETT